MVSLKTLSNQIRWLIIKVDASKFLSKWNHSGKNSQQQNNFQNSLWFRLYWNCPSKYPFKFSFNEAGLIELKKRCLCVILLIKNVLVQVPNKWCEEKFEFYLRDLRTDKNLLQIKNNHNWYTSKIAVVVVATPAQHSMSLGRSLSGDPSLTSSVGSTPTKHT
jgi:hypothetical protein